MYLVIEFFFNSNYPSLSHEQIFCVGQIQATDPDLLHKNSFIFYEISEIEGVRPSRRHSRFDHKATELFYVNQTTGLICVHNDSLYKFDREVKSLYNFRFSAINKLAAREQKSSVLVEVVLKDLNDNRPEFSLSEYTFFIPERDSNVVTSLLYPTGTSGGKRGRPVRRIQVGRVIAIDKDSGINSQLRYFDVLCYSGGYCRAG